MYALTMHQIYKNGSINRLVYAPQKHLICKNKKTLLDIILIKKYRNNCKMGRTQSKKQSFQLFSRFFKNLQ